MQLSFGGLERVGKGASASTPFWLTNKMNTRPVDILLGIFRTDKRSRKGNQPLQDVELMVCHKIAISRIEPIPRAGNSAVYINRCKSQTIHLHYLRFIVSVW